MARRRKQPQKPSIQETTKHSHRVPTGLIVSILLALVLGGIPFVMGKYIEFNSPGPFDSGAYVYSAKHLLDGAQYGVDELSSARPGTLLVNIIGVKLFGFNDTGPKVVQMLLQLAALVFMFITLRNVFGSVAAVTGTTIAAIYLSAPLIAKFGNVKEQFMIAFMIYAACAFLWYAVTSKWYWLVLTGFFALQPHYFKPTGLSIVFALVGYILISNVIARKWKQLAVQSGLFVAGYVAGLVVPGLFFVWQNMPTRLLSTIPVVLLQVGVVLAAVFAAIIVIIHFTIKSGLLKHLRSVQKWIWLTGICLMIITLAVSLLLIKIKDGSISEDLTYYLKSIPFISLPRYLYNLMASQFHKLIDAAGLEEGYVGQSLSARGLAQLAPQVFRYYKALSVPIIGALCSIVVAAGVWIHARAKKTPVQNIQSKVVWMLLIWWLLDMAFVWISPRSYEQYYLPLCGSGAVLTGYAVWAWQQRLAQTQNKMPWLAGGVAVAVILGCLSIPIFIGQRYSPDRGKALDYIETYGQRRRGFGSALDELEARQNSAWITTGKYIRDNSTPDDTLYVWGWIPGIYIEAQRMAPVAKAFEANMHVTPPQLLSRQISAMVNTLQKNPPKFIVDTHKRHFPNDRPPLELWPIIQPGTFGNEKGRLLSTNPQEIAAYDAGYKQMLAEIDPDEAERYEAMKPFREFVMNHYKLAGQFGSHLVFERN